MQRTPAHGRAGVFQPRFCQRAGTARSAGMPTREAWRLGALMNTRGLMELIVLNLGYELGLLGDRLFAVLVIMALVTTAMTGPLLNLIERRRG